jgi:transforming growth factor-beta-induced protein
MVYASSERPPDIVSTLPTDGKRSLMRTTHLVVLAGVLSFTAAACGGSDGTSATTTSASTLPGTSIIAGTSAGGSIAPDSTGPDSSTGSVPAPTKSILQLAKEEGTLTTLLGLLDTAGITASLQGNGPFTLVAPTDAAFRKMDPDTLAKITASPTVLKQLLNYHVINGRVTSKDLAAGFSTSVEGTTIALQQATGQLPTLNGLIIRKAGRATNGTVLVVDSVLIPVDIKLP